MHEHRAEERPERSVVHTSEIIATPPMRWLTDEEPLRGEIPVRELVAEEHADDGGDRERAEDPGLLASGVKPRLGR